MASLISQRDDIDKPQISINDIDDTNDDFLIHRAQIQNNIPKFTSMNIIRRDTTYNLNYDVVIDDIENIYYSPMNNYILLRCFKNEKNINFAKQINNFFEKLESKIDKNEIFSELYKGSHRLNNFNLTKKKCYSKSKNHLKIKLKFEKTFDYISQMINLKLRWYEKTNDDFRFIGKIKDDKVDYQDLELYLNNPKTKFNLYLTFRIVITCDYRFGEPMFNMYQVINLNKIDIIDCSRYLGFTDKVLEKPFYCPICMENETHSVLCNECKNCMCKECFDKYDINNGCPYCRAEWKKN